MSDIDYVCICVSEQVCSVAAGGFLDIDAPPLAGSDKKQLVAPRRQSMQKQRHKCQHLGMALESRQMPHWYALTICANVPVATST